MQKANVNFIRIRASFKLKRVVVLCDQLHLCGQLDLIGRRITCWILHVRRNVDTFMKTVSIRRHPILKYLPNFCRCSALCRPQVLCDTDPCTCEKCKGCDE